MYSTEEVAQHMQTLLSSANENERNASHQFLLNFQAAPEAWGICRELMAPNIPYIPLFVSAQIFYKKVQTEWHLLDTIQKQELKNYLLDLVQLNFNCPQAFKKLCQSLALVGILSMNLFWDTFIVDILKLRKLEVVLEVIDCIPFCLEEFNLAKKTAEFIKTKVREQVQDILEFLYIVLCEKGYLIQILEVLKNWRTITLPIFKHPEFFKRLVNAMSDVEDENFTNLCETFCNALNCSESAMLLQKNKYTGNTQDFLKKIPQEELKSLVELIEVVLTIKPKFMNHEESTVRRRGCDLILAICTDFMFMLIDSPYTEALWVSLAEITSHSDLSICMTGIEFYYELKEIFIKKVDDLQNRPYIFQYLLKCAESLALRCRFLSQDHFLHAVAEKVEEVPFLDFRISAEDVFYSIFMIFEKHHENKGRGFLLPLGSLLHPPIAENNAEVFVFIMRSLLLGLTETENFKTLEEDFRNCPEVASWATYSKICYFSNQRHR
ncbi:unnamed protein product [Blepharisma stoltei]|uniref:Importin N-terminal domain-containing protein n=1 Tax=Blepharisma stoltei TaxID=1481888 RepID=A0AAU9J6H7_9CILI|nr:unnamed protein product [Blepharisma stoltei]